MKYLLIVLLLSVATSNIVSSTSVPASTEVLTSQQVCLPSSLLKEMVETEVRDAVNKSVHLSYKTIHHLCATQGYITVILDGKRIRINCQPTDQI